MRVTKVRDESTHVRSVYFGAADGARLPEWLPGQSITLRVLPEPPTSP